MTSKTSTPPNFTNKDHNDAIGPLLGAKENLEDFHLLLICFVIYLLILFLGAIGKFETIASLFFSETWKNLLKKKKVEIEATQNFEDTQNHNEINSVRALTNSHYNEYNPPLISNINLYTGLNYYWSVLDSLAMQDQQNKVLETAVHF